MDSFNLYLNRQLCRSTFKASVDAYAALVFEIIHDFLLKEALYLPVILKVYITVAPLFKLVNCDCSLLSNILYFSVYLFENV